MTVESIHQRPLAYAERLDQRDLEDVSLIVVHCTELPDLAAARTCGERILYPDSGTGNSGHFYVDRDGRLEQWVPLDRVAHHVRGQNRHSIGIELVNRGRYPDWLASGSQQMTEPYTRRQLDALVGLLNHLHQLLPGPCRLTGHEFLDRERVSASDGADLTVRRKVDPGPLFPWDEVIDRVSMEAWFGEAG